MTIDREILERLLIDRAVGALPPDVDVLLDDCLERNPAAAAEAEKFALTADLARRALAPVEGRNEYSLPPLALRRRRMTVRRIAARVAALAACLLIGLVLGIRLSPSPPAVEASAPVASVSVGEGSEPTAATYTSEIWSIQRFREALARPRRREGLHLVWDSPTKMPRLEERS